MTREKRRYVHQHGIVGGFVLGIRGVDLKVLDGGDAADGLPFMLDTFVAAGTGGVGGHFVGLCSVFGDRVDEEDDGYEEKRKKRSKKRASYRSEVRRGRNYAVLL